MNHYFLNSAGTSHYRQNVILQRICTDASLLSVSGDLIHSEQLKSIQKIVIKRQVDLDLQKF